MGLGAVIIFRGNGGWRRISGKFAFEIGEITDLSFSLSLSLVVFAFFFFLPSAVETRVLINYSARAEAIFLFVKDFLEVYLGSFREF